MQNYPAQLALLLAASAAIPGQSLELVKDLKQGFGPNHGTVAAPYAEVGGLVYGSRSHTFSAPWLVRFDPKTGASMYLDHPRAKPRAYGSVQLPTGPHLWIVDYENKLWFSDVATGDGTVAYHGLQAPLDPVSDGRSVYFTIWEGSGQVLYRHDGINLIAVHRAASIRGATPVSSSKVYFTAPQSASSGAPLALWVTNGTAAGTRVVANPGPIQGPLSVFGDKVLFRAGSKDGIEPYVSDGTKSGTFQLKDIRSGPASSDADLAGGLHDGSRYVFRANDGVHGSEIWETDGTKAGTRLLVDLGPGSSNPAKFARAGKALVFSADVNRSYHDAYAFDGSRAYPLGVEVHTAEGFCPTGNGNVVFQSVGEVFLTDGTVAGTKRVPTPNTLARVPQDFFALSGGGAVFHASGPRHDRKIWRTDGTIASTRLLFDLTPGESPAGSAPRFARSSRANSGWLLFSAEKYDERTWYQYRNGEIQSLRTFTNRGVTIESVEFGRRGRLLRTYTTKTPLGPYLYATDGTHSTLLSDKIGQYSEFGRLDDGVLFVGSSAAGTELWVHDGTSARMVRDLAPGPQSSYPRSFARFGARVLLTAVEPYVGWKVWITDGTGAGTVKLTPTGLTKAPTEFLVLGSHAWFVSGKDLWRTDGSPAGTRKVATLNVRRRTRLFAVRGRLYAYDNDSAPDSWISIWTGSRMLRVAKLAVGHGEVAVSGPLAYFSSPGHGGVQPEVFDSGSNRIRKLPISGESRFVTTGDGGVYFIGHALATGHELYYADGSATGTRLVAELIPGPLSGCHDLIQVGGELLVSGVSPQYGAELFRLRGAKHARVVHEGSGCRELGSTALDAEAPVLGKIAAIRGNLPSSVPALAVLIGLPTNNPLSFPSLDGCALRIDPQGPVALVAIGSSANILAPIAIPNAPILNGASVVVQGIAASPRMAASNAIRLVIGH